MSHPKLEAALTPREIEIIQRSQRQQNSFPDRPRSQHSTVGGMRDNTIALENRIFSPSIAACGLYECHLPYGRHKHREIEGDTSN